MISRIKPVAHAGVSPGADEEAAVAVLRQFRQVFNAVKSHFQQVEKTVGMGGAQVCIGALAKAMSIHQSTASNLVRALVEREMVAAAKAGIDRRAVQLTLLPAGAKVLQSISGPFDGLLPGALKSLPPETLARLQEDLAQLIVAIAADEAGAAIPLSGM